MKLAHEDTNKRTIKGRETITFSSNDGLHLLIITARAKGEKNISPLSTDDEDLIVKINDITFPTLGSETKLLDSPAAFNGGKLHGTSKTIYFLINLMGHEHNITLETDTPPGTATFESLKVYTLDPSETFNLELNNQSVEKDREPWITIVVNNLALQSFDITAKVNKRPRDSDDLKIIVDGEIKTNFTMNWYRNLWLFVGSILKGQQETSTVDTNLQKGLHYIEFWADRTPTIRSIKLNFGELVNTEKKTTTPTVENPEWTGNLNHDSETMILARAIYAEAGGESYDAKVAMGWTIRNRLEDKLNRWPKTYHGVILDLNQYEPFINEKDKAFIKLSNPPVHNPLEKNAWEDSYNASASIISGSILDPTYGANHFHAEKPEDTPRWADENRLTLQIGITKFYKL